MQIPPNLVGFFCILLFCQKNTLLSKMNTQKGGKQAVAERVSLTGKVKLFPFCFIY